MAFTAKDNCPENQWNYWSYWNEDKKKWNFEKSSLMTICKPPPSSEGGNGNASAELKHKAENNASASTVEKGRRTTISTSTCL